MNLLLLLHLLLLPFSTPNTPENTPADSLKHARWERGKQWAGILLPAGMIAYGVITVNDHRQILGNTWHTKADDYIQFAPAAALLALQPLGVSSPYGLKGNALRLLGAYVLTFAVVIPSKALFDSPRPDYRGNLESFPSGHTAAAFAGAECLRLAYRHRSPWYGIAGYTVATATGLMRMANNRHWLSDVVAGAGIGILSAKASYWLIGKMDHKKGNGKAYGPIITPFYRQQQWGLGGIWQF